MFLGVEDTISGRAPERKAELSPANGRDSVTALLNPKQEFAGAPGR